MPLPIFRFLDTVGDGSGTKNAVGDYSSGQDFKCIHPVGAGTTFYIERMIVKIVDAGTFNADGYGALGVLSNGIEVLAIDPNGNTFINITDDVPIHSNADWTQQCYDMTLHDFGVGNGNKFVVVRWTFAKAGRPIPLKAGFSIAVRLSDSFVGLVDHYFSIQGFTL